MVAAGVSLQVVFPARSPLKFLCCAQVQASLQSCLCKFLLASFFVRFIDASFSGRVFRACFSAQALCASFAQALCTTISLQVVAWIVLNKGGRSQRKHREKSHVVHADPPRRSRKTTIAERSSFCRSPPRVKFDATHMPSCDLVCMQLYIYIYTHT